MSEAADRRVKRVALIGDIHDYALGIWPWELLGKTLAGQMNLWLNRRKRFDRYLIEPTVRRVLECRPDLVLFSGDFTTTSRPREFRSIVQRLKPLLNAHECVAIAGNHDRYTFTAERSQRFETFFHGHAPTTMPMSRPIHGGWRLITVDAAVPRLLDSMGEIGNRQLQHVASLLQSVAEYEGVIILVHYPIGKPPQLPPMNAGHRLVDEHAWRDTIAHCAGRVIIVHGHVHCPWLWKPEMECIADRRPMRLLDVNSGSPTMISGDRGAWPRGQGFWILELHDDATRPITLTHHVMGEGEGAVGLAPDQPITRVRADDADRWVSRTVQVLI